MSDERITSLPVLSDLDGSEWLVVDDGSTTYRIPSDTYREAENATKVTLSSVKSISDSTVTVVSWDGTEFDDLGAWDSGSPRRLTVPSGVSRIRLWTAVVWDANNTGRRQVRFAKNGSFLHRFDERAAESSSAAAGAIVLTVASGDYFELEVYQSSGGALDFGKDATQFGMEKLA